MKKLVSLALALVLILGVTVVPASASSDTDYPAGWEGTFRRDECTCGDNPIRVNSSMFWDMGMNLDSRTFDDQGHTVAIQVHDIHKDYDPISIDLRTDGGKALYAEYEAKWQAMKNGEADKTATDTTGTPVTTVTKTDTGTTVTTVTKTDTGTRVTMSVTGTPAPVGMPVPTPVATPTPTPAPTATPTSSAKQVNPDFDETVFTDLGLYLMAFHYNIDTGITSYVIFGLTVDEPIEQVTNAIGDKTYAKYKAIRDAAVMKEGDTSVVKVDLASKTPASEKPSTPPTEPPVVTTPPPIEPPATPTAFPDVAPDAWYAEAVNAMTDAGIIKGDGNGNFRPDDTVTYGEFVTILARIANLSTECPHCKADPDYEHCYTTYNCYGRRLVAWNHNNLPHWAWPAAVKLEIALWSDTQMIVNPEDMNCNIVRGHALANIYKTMQYVGLDTTPVNSYVENHIPDWNDVVGVDNHWGYNVYYLDGQLHFLPDEFVYHDFYKCSDSGYAVNVKAHGYDMDSNKIGVTYVNPDMKPYVAANPYDVLAMYNLGVTEGVDAAHTCAPLRTMTRAELCVLLQRAGLDHVFSK